MALHSKSVRRAGIPRSQFHGLKATLTRSDGRAAEWRNLSKPEASHRKAMWCFASLLPLNFEKHGVWRQRLGASQLRLLFTANKRHLHRSKRDKEPLVVDAQRRG